MIEKLKGIRIKGRCFKSDTDLIFYENQNDRTAIVFGKNGSGKSTISEGIASISNKDPENSDLLASFIDLEHNTISFEKDSGIYVFNEKYIDENVKIDDDGLETIVLLGNQVGLQEEIEAQREKVRLLSEKIDNVSREYSKYQDKSNMLSPDYHQSKIMTLLKKDGGWAKIDSQIKGNKINSQVTAATIEEIGKLVVKEPLADLQKKFGSTQILMSKVSDGSISYPNSVEQVFIDSDFESQIVNLLAQEIEEPILSEREKRIMESIQKGFQERIESAISVFSQENTSVCPYCYQPVTDRYKQDLVHSINKVLNKDVDEHKAQLNSIKYPVLEINISSFESLDAELVKKIEQQLERCKTLLSQYKDLIKQKAGNIYTPIKKQEIGLYHEIQELNALLRNLELKRQEFNDAAKEKDSIVKELISINKSIAHYQIEPIYKDLIRQEKAKKKTQTLLNEYQDNLEREKKELETLQDRKANIGLAIENINNSLDYVFLSHNRLSIELRNGKYYLKSNGVNVLPKKVSQGERNIIALCYFFTQIFSNQEIGNLYQSESLIVIDDPVSSFDFENKIGINSFLRYQVGRIINGNANSKILFLSHDLETVFALQKAIGEIRNTTKDITNKEVSCCTLELDNLKLSKFKKNHGEYGALLEKIYSFANENSKDDSLVIGNVMRRALEAFSTFTYRQNIEKVSLDKNVKKALGEYSIFFENLMYRIVLHGESHYKEQVDGMRDSNNFFEFISEDEKIKTAKKILCFMYILNPYHIMAYLQSVDGAIENIKNWVNNIPKNESFEIKQKGSVKRHIPLYDLPLSAGIGNDSFENIPYVDFETENMICDFALKVSGNSMEPKVPNGSIVLVERNAKIDDGQIGAFYYNGKVYCKFMKHEKGETFLCSYNSAYLPIKIGEEDELFPYGKVVEIIANFIET